MVSISAYTSKNLTWCFPFRYVGVVAISVKTYRFSALHKMNTAEEQNARLQRENDQMKAQLAAAQKALALKHLPLPTEEQEDGDDPGSWSYAGLCARYCAALRRETEYVESRTELVARLYLKEIAAGAHFTVSEGAAAETVIRAEKRIYALKTRLTAAEATVEAYKDARDRDLERIDTLEARVAELGEEGVAAAEK